MNCGRVFNIFFSFVTSALITGTVYVWDFETRFQTRSTASLQLARQVTNQIETLTLFAREKQETDPLGWAVQFLANGPENRPVLISPLSTVGIAKSEPEKYTLNQKGIFNYSKITDPTSGEGVKIQIHTGYFGFLGSNAPWLNDLWVLVLFSLIFSTVVRIKKRSTPREELSEGDLDGTNDNEDESILNIQMIVPKNTSSNTTSNQDLRKLVISWVGDSKPILMQLGIHVRNLIREAKTLAVASSNSKSFVEKISENCNHLSETLSQFEIAIEKNAGPTVARELSQKIKESVHNISKNSQEAFHAYEGVTQATRDMNEHITKASSTLIEEAKMMQKLKESVDSQSGAQPFPQSTLASIK